MLPGDLLLRANPPLGTRLRRQDGDGTCGCSGDLGNTVNNAGIDRSPGRRGAIKVAVGAFFESRAWARSIGTREGVQDLEPRAASCHDKHRPEVGSAAAAGRAIQTSIAGFGERALWIRSFGLDKGVQRGQ